MIEDKPLILNLRMSDRGEAKPCLDEDADGCQEGGEEGGGWVPGRGRGRGQTAPPNTPTPPPPIRRSKRKPKKELLKEQMKEIEAKLLNTDDSTLDIKIARIGNKGRGIVSKRAFAKGEFIVEYAGELISYEESIARCHCLICCTNSVWKAVTYFLFREAEYEKDPSKGCYMYWFKHKGTDYW